MITVIEWAASIVAWFAARTVAEWVALILVAWVMASIASGPIIGKVLGRRSDDHPAAPPVVDQTAALPAVPPREGMTAIDRQTGTQRRAAGGAWR